MHARVHVALAVSGLVLGAGVAWGWQSLRPLPEPLWIRAGLIAWPPPSPWPPPIITLHAAPGGHRSTVGVAQILAEDWRAFVVERFTRRIVRRWRPVKFVPADCIFYSEEPEPTAGERGDWVRLTAVRK